MANLKDKIVLIQNGEQLSAETLNRSVESLADQVDIKFSEFELDIQEGLAPVEAKLAGIADGATKNRADSLNADKFHAHTLTDVTGLTDALGNKVDTVEGKGLSSNDFTTTLKDKLDGIDTGAQANVNADWTSSTGDSQILNKPTLGTVSSLDTGNDGEQIRTNTQAEIYFVAKAFGKDLSDENYTQVDKTKLEGIAPEATKNRADSENADKIHTHSTDQVVGLTAALVRKVDKVAGKGLSDTNFTQAEKDKLSSLQSSKFIGLFVSEDALPATGSVGAYADVDGGTDSDVYRMIWDSSDRMWVRVQGVTGDLTAAQIKQQYEINSDTNAFTDNEKSKLTSIDTGATKNRADSENADKVHTHTTAQVTGLDATLTRKAFTNDPRFADEREWTAATISQAEAEDGVATTRRAFTAQRVRQSIVAWFNGISGALGRTILSRTTTEQVRSDIGLGSVDNTSDVDKPVSTMVADALDTKVDKVVGKGLSTEDYTTDEKGKLSEVESGATKNETDAALRDRGTHTGEQPISTISGLALELSEKVIKETGKSLSSEDFTLTHKNKVESVETGSTKNKTDAFLVERANHTGEQPINTVFGLQAALNTKTDKENGKSLLSNDEISKLLTVAQGATKNSTDAALRDRTTHTGKQSIESIIDLDTTLFTKVDKVTGYSLLSDTEIVRLSNMATGATKNATDAQLRDRTTHTGMQPTSTITGLDAAILSKVDKVPGKSLLSDTEITRLSNMATGATKNDTNEELRDRATHTGKSPLESVTGLDDALETKVDKIDGMGLSAEDFTTALKAKLAGVATGATKNSTDAQLRDRATHTGLAPISGVDGLSAVLDTKVVKVLDSSLLKDSEITRLSNMATGATKNATDAALRDRGTHTGTQAIGTISGLQTELNARVDKVVGKGLSTEDFTTALKTKLDDVDTDATKNATDADLRDRTTHTGTQAISTVAGLGDALDARVDKVLGESLVKDTEIARLANMATGATKNATDAALRARASHTGEQAISTVTGLQTALDDRVNKVTGKGLSTEDYTTAEKTKLGGVATGATKNATDVALRDRTTHTGFQPISTVTGLQVALDSKVAKVLDSSLVADSEIARLAGMATGATKNLTDSALLSRANHTGEQAISTVTGLQSELDTKVDKVPGKALSTEDYTTAEKGKLDNVATGATKNATDAALRARSSHTGTQAISTIDGLQTALDDRVNKVTGESLIKATEIARLSGMATGATKNATDAALRDRTTHTGEQAIATVTGLQTALDDRVNKVTGKGLSTNDYTTAEKTKLGGVATGATKNATDAQLRDRTTHTGMQPTSTITGLDAAILSKVDKVPGKGLSSQDYTLAEKQKLASLESSKYRGVYQSFSALVAAVTTPTAGDYADVDAGVGHDPLRHIYDGSDAAWIPQESNPAITASAVKDYYESNANTNAYTDAEKTKLGGVATGATKNATDAALRARSSHTGEQAISTITGLQTGLDSKVSIVSGKDLSTNDYTTAEKTKLSGIATGATKNATDATLLSRTNHTGAQAISTVTGLQGELDSKVNAEVGKGLIPTTELTRLGNMATGATKNATDATLLARANHTGTQAISTITGLQTGLDSKVNAVEGKGLSSEDYTLAEKTKLSGISAGATKNSTDATLLARANHTGTQAISTISGLQAAIDDKVVKVTGKVLSSNDYTTAEKTKLGNVNVNATVNSTDATLLARANHTGTQAISTITGLQTAIDSKVNTEDGKSLISDTEITRLAGIATGATKNATDAQLRARSSHTGTQAISTITGLQAAIDDKVVKETGKGLSTNDYTTAEKTKLGGVATGATKNATDATLLARANHTGVQAISTITGLQTAIDSKVNTEDGKSLISDTEITRLAGMISDATKNATDAQLRARSGHTGTQAMTTIDGLAVALSEKVDKVTGKGLSANDYTSAEKTKLGGVATGATANSTDAQLRARSSHTGEQAISTITGLQAGLDAKANSASLGTAATKNVGTSAGNVMEVGAFGWGTVAKVNYPNSSIDDVAPSGLYYATSAQGFPVSPDGHLVVMSYSNIWATQIAYDYRTGREFVRARNNGTWQPWLETVSSGNLLQATGSSTTFPMSQKATTDALNSTTTVLNNKVDKETGKGLSTNDYTTTEKTKLSGVATGATKNATDAQLRDRATHTGTQAVSTITGLGNVATRNVGTTANTIMAGDDSRVVANTSKLSGIATGATKNQTDAYLLNRVNHTGTQPTSTITGLDAELLTKVVKETGKGLSSNDYTTTEKNKLGAIAAGATANSTDAQLRARSSHTGTQAISTIDGLQTAINNKADTSTQVIAGTGLSGGGTLAANRTLNVSYGTAAGTAAQGNDSRINNGQTAFNRLNIGATAATARTALQLGAAATKDEEYFALRAGTAAQDFTTKEVSTVAANIRATTGSEGVKLEYNHTSKTLDFNFF